MSRHLTAAAVIASSIFLGGSWLVAAQASEPVAPDACAEVIRLGEKMTEHHGRIIGTMGARSVSLRLGHTEDVDRLTLKLDAAWADYQSTHLAFREAAANCR
jgi:hypothetical protein